MAGVFPFGRPSTARPARVPDRPAEAFVLGVYPSALHVAWRLPRWYADGTRVAAMAVDVEPVVFWDGLDPVQDDLIASWKAAAGFVDGDDEGGDGNVASVRLNGSSGRVVTERVLEPLSLTSDRVWMTDALTTFFVKSGGRRRREQGDVLRDVYDPYAAAAGRPPSNLPIRPTPAALVRQATTGERDRLRRELLESEAPVVITLGEEARQVLEAVADDVRGQPTAPLTAEDYGRDGEASIDGHRVQWWALAHPGQRSSRWAEAHDRWIASRRS